MLLPLKMANSSDRQLKKLVWNAVTDSCTGAGNLENSCNGGTQGVGVTTSNMHHTDKHDVACPRFGELTQIWKSTLWDVAQPFKPCLEPDPDDRGRF